MNRFPYRGWVCFSLVLMCALSVHAAQKKKPKPADDTPATTQPAGGSAAAAANVIKLPAPVEGVAVGGSGQFLVLHLKKLQQLAIYDVPAGKVVKYLPLQSNDITFTAGAEKVYVGLRDLKQIQRFSLTTFELELTTPAPEGGVAELAMGACATAPLLMISEQHAKLFWEINPANMQGEKFPSHHWGGNGGGAWGPISVHVSFDGSTSVACGGGWAGIEVGTIVGGRVTDVAAGSYVHGDAQISGNGQLIFVDKAGILRNDLETKVTGIDGSPFPADDPAFSLSFDKGKNNKPSLILYSNADPHPLLVIRNLGELSQNSKMPLWQRIHLIPRYNTLITLGTGGDQLMVRPFDLAAELAAGGLDYLFVLSSPSTTVSRSAPFQYVMKVMSKKGGVKTQLQAGPPGMTVSAEGTIDWKVPANFTAPTASVIVQVSDSSGQTIFHSFVLRVPVIPVQVVAATPAPVVKPAIPSTPTPSRTTPQPKPPNVSMTPPKSGDAPKVTPASPIPPLVVARANVNPTSPGTEDNPMIVQLEEPYTEYHAAAGGAKLVFYEPKAQKLAVYETATGKAQGAIAMGAQNIRFACGNDAIVVALPDQRILQTYSLSTLQRVKSAPFPNSQPLKEMKMGTASAGPLFLYFGGEMVAVDVQTLTPLKLRGSLPSGNPNSWFTFRVSADGSTLVAWDPRLSPPNFSINRIKNGAVSTVESPGGSMATRRFTPTADGSFILYETKVYNAAGAQVDSTLKGYNNLVPTCDPRFVIAVREKEGDRHEKHSDIAICTATDRRVLVEMTGLSCIGDLGGYDQGRAGICNDMPGVGEPRVVFLPAAKTLALLPIKNDHFELIHIDLNGPVASATAVAGGSGTGARGSGVLAVISLPPREVAVGETYSYQIQTVPENAKPHYKLESGPEGMSVSAKGEVTWKVKQRPIGGKATAIISVTDSAGYEVPHSFEINVVRGAPTAAASAAGQSSSIVTLDKTRLELPSHDFSFRPGLRGRALILAGDQLAIVAPDGFTIQESHVLARKYTAIAERKDYYVAIGNEPCSIDLLDKKTLAVIKSRPIPFNRLIEISLHPTLAISFISYQQPSDKLQYHFLIFDETTVEAQTDDNWIGAWLAISPDGDFLMTAFQEFYEDGHDIIDNPDRIWIVPKYGSMDVMARYDLREDGAPSRVSHREGVGGGGNGLRLSADGKRAAYLSHAGYPSPSGNAAAWNPLDLKQLPVSYLTKGKASCTELAFHPLLPLVAVPGKGSVTFFDRETGQELPSRIDQQTLAGEDIQHLFFSPDGTTLLLHTKVGGVDYLLHLPLQLTAEETKALRALPHSDKRVSPLRPADKQAPAKKLQEASTSPGINNQISGLSGAGA